MIGMILGDRYELIEIIGEGGMATVYKARDKKLNRLVAVKVLKKEFADNDDIAQKFKKEATAIANLSDMNIVSVLDVGHENEENIDYFVMELVDGKTLKEIILTNGKIGWSTAITIAIQVAKALDCAHRNGIIHRDVKPQNILITEHGDVKVTDFGIAKSATSSTITNTTTIMGSAHYLSPEQAKGTFIDYRTDLYSLGIVLYEMVTGKLPFEGESPVTIALKHIQEDAIQPKKINDSIPESLNNLIVKAISKEPVARYKTAKELISDLQKVKENPDIKILINENSDAGRTIIMQSIKDPIEEKRQGVDEINKKNNRNIEANKSEFDKPKNKKIKGVLIGVFIVVSLLLLGVLGFVLADGIGNKGVEIPNVIGKNIDEVKNELGVLGLKVEVIATKNSDKPEGSILESDPTVGTTIAKDSVVKVVVSGGVEKFIVPDLRENEENVIKQYLDNKNIKYELKYEFNEKVEKGYCVGVSPSVGTEISIDETIIVTISKGPEVKLVKVKNYIGYDLVEAKEALEKLRFVVLVEEIETDRKSENGKVLDQPIKDIEVKEGTEITLYAGKYIEPTTDVSQIIHEGMLLVDGINALEAQKIKYSIEGGIPQQSELNLYTIVGFTTTIKEGEIVNIAVKKNEVEQPNPEEETKPEETP